MVDRAILCTLAICLSGCLSAGPERVFRKSTGAFADGEIRRGARHFSERLLAARPLEALEAYYASTERRKGVAYLLKELRFELLEETPTAARARVTWTTGLTESVYFVHEGSRWKLDLPPAPTESIPAADEPQTNP